MPMKRCDADLHFYDPDKHPDGCPYCREKSMGGNMDSTRPVSDPIYSYEDDTEATERMSPPRYRTEPETDEGMTIGIFKKKAGFEPVVGWLVCIEGVGKGKDFRIKPGINKIGRGGARGSVDILLKGDRMISRENHAEIEYDDGENAFYLIRGRSAAVKLEGRAVRQPELLQPYDEIELGESRFKFVPFCWPDKFQWPVDEKSDQ